MSGNTGTQSLGVTIRVLSDDDFSRKAKIKFIFKELRVGLLNGLIMGLISFIFIGLYVTFLTDYPTQYGIPYYGFSISSCIAFSLIATTIIASLVGTITGLLGGDSVEGILGTIATLANTQYDDNGEIKSNAILVVYDEDGNVVDLGLDLTVQGFAEEYARYSNANATFAARLLAAEKWSDVSAAGINWGVNGSIASFVKAFASILNPLNCVLELLLLGEGKTLGVLPTRDENGAIKKDAQGMPIHHGTPVADKARFTEFALMGIKPCVYFRMNTNEEDYRQALENGAIGFTCDHPDICGEILDKLGARKLKK